MYDINRPRKDSSGFNRTSQFVVDHFTNWQLSTVAPPKFSSPYSMPMIAAVGGGKGGVGKSIVSANLASIWAQFGYRVLVIDLDIGCSNLHSHFGVSMPKRTIADFLITQKLPFRDIILPAPVHGVAFVAGGREDRLLKTMESSREARNTLWNAIYESKKNYKVDIVLFDLGAGTHQHTLDFFIGSHLGIVTVLPESTSIENAYVFLKMVLMRMIINMGYNTRQEEAAMDIVESLGAMTSGSISRGYAHHIDGLRQSYPRFVHNYLNSLKSRYTGVLINQIRDRSDIEVGRSMEQICKKYFGMQAKDLGYLSHDQAVLDSLKNRKLLIAESPTSTIAKNMLTSAQVCLDVLGVQRRAI